MKVFGSTSLLVTAALVLASPASTSASGPASFSTTNTLATLSISPADFPRFLADKSTLEAELKAWKASPAGQYAQQHGFIVSPKGVMDADAIKQDQLHRLFLTKQHIQDVQRENPDAEFSLDSPFTLMTDDEFAAYVRKSYRRDEGSALRGVLTPSRTTNTTASSTTTTTAATTALAEEGVGLLQDTDWTTSGCVAAIKNQGQCGSCWAFASVAALESAYCLKGHEMTTFSEQQVTSCDSESHGCEGGFPGDGLSFIKKNGGVCSDRDYPYTSGESGQSGECQANQCSAVGVSIQQVVSVPESESGLLQAVQKTPVAVGVAAGNRTWKQYKGGVVSTCASSELDHAVVVVGFGGSGSASPFFKIRNSWGTAWGESGYIRLKRGVPGAGVCGVVGPKSVYPVL